MFYSDSGLYSPHQRWLPNTLPGLPWGYLPQIPDFSLRCRQSRQISSSFRMSLGAVRSSHSNRDTFRFVPSISFPPVSVSSAAGYPRPAHSTAVLRTARLFRKAHCSNRRPPPSLPHTGISARSAAPQLFAQPAFFHTRLPPLWKITRRCPRSSGWGGSPSSLSTHSPPVRSGSADRTGTPPIPFWAPPAPGRCSGRSCRCSASRRRCGD